MKKKIKAEELPRVPEPYEIKHGAAGVWTLWKRRKNKESEMIRVCKAQSENGAHREGILFLDGKFD